MFERKSLGTLLICGVVVAAGAWLASAGDLSPPPGPVGPTLKTLTEVEPRIAVNDVNTPADAAALRVISQPGSYYLTGNITGVSGKAGIKIATGDVVLDLSGFTLAGVAGSTDGITVANEPDNIAVRNGVIRDWPVDGVVAWSADNCQFERLFLYNNGQRGLRAGDNSMVRACTAESNGSWGIAVGAGCTASDCASSYNSGSGFSDGGGCTIIGCTASYNAGDGIQGNAGTLVTNCSAHRNTGDGIDLLYYGHAVGNSAYYNGLNGTGAGVYAFGSNNHIEGNVVTNNDYGIQVDMSPNMIIRNTANSNSLGNYQISAGNHYGQIVTSPGAGFVSSDPWANFDY